MGQLAVSHMDPALVATFAEELARPTPADELVSGLIQFVAELSREDAREFSSTFASQLAAQADSMIPQDGARLLLYAAKLSGLSMPNGPEYATLLSQSYALYPTLEVAQEAGELLATEDGEPSEAERVARAQLDSSITGFEALKQTLEAWLDSDRLEEMLELLVSTAGIHPASRRFLLDLNAHLHPEDIVEPPAPNAEASRHDEDASEETIAEQLSLLDVTVKDTPAASPSPTQPSDEEALPSPAAQAEETLAVAIVAPHRARMMLEAREALVRARTTSTPFSGGAALAYEDDERPSGASKQIARARDRGAQGDWEGASNELAQAIRKADVLTSQYHMMVELARIYEVELDDLVRAERAYRRARAAVPASIPALSFYRRLDDPHQDAAMGYSVRADLHHALVGDELNGFRTEIAEEMAHLAQADLQDPKRAAQAWTLLLQDRPSFFNRFQLGDGILFC